MEETSKHTQAILQIGTEMTHTSRGSDREGVRWRNRPFHKAAVIEEGSPEEEGPSGPREMGRGTSRQPLLREEPRTRAPGSLDPSHSS